VAYKRVKPTYLVLIECNEWEFAKGSLFVILQHLNMRTAAPLWKILILECVYFSPDIPGFRRYFWKCFGFPWKYRV